ncbi:OLC1v1007601C1 [Oldenlandia corymbosa var. corymbosa]|uniref:OLC1v1007601C1 n=1 Tax=Oldenlandia corymbosa var. corymbosa TaxID=529605 RepID=A0AAV1DJK1_OLDCO|nr:OLC1v1007601C1 [Oldenlandia corymbosa var. corymbosa]
MESSLSESSTKINLKLLVDKTKRRVLFAEAGKDFVDFFFGLMELPLGAVISHLVERGMVKSWPISKVYEAVQNIDPIYLQPNQSKTTLLNPKTSPLITKQTPMLHQFGCIVQQQVYSPGSYQSSSSRKELVDGYVKGMVAYMVMDDLTIKPMSTISCITILNNFQVKDVGCLEEKSVEIDMETALKMIKACFQSTTVLTDVFLKPEEISIVKMI